LCLSSVQQFLIESDTAILATSYINILDKAAQWAKHHKNIHKSTQVVSVENTSRDDKPALVRTANNSTFKFDDVVVAVPMGSLKRRQPEISPPLNPGIIRAIDRAPYKLTEKVYLRFHITFWEMHSEVATSEDRKT
jgi:monoamine oxidase